MNLTMNNTTTAPVARPRTGHDRLHDFALFSRCWCFCPRCWQPFTKTTGRCVCDDCPCPTARLGAVR